jgi:hypothetical protein
MTTLDHDTYAIRRKGYAPHYTTSNVALFQPEMHDAVLELIKVTSYVAQPYIGFIVFIDPREPGWSNIC